MPSERTRARQRLLPPIVARSAGPTFQSLENAPFARYFWGTTAFFFAMNMQIMLRGWLVYLLTKDPFALGLINAAFAIPTLLLSPVGGVVADRFDRRMVIVVSQLAQLVITILTTVLVLSGLITYPQLLLLSVAAAAAGSFNMPARQAIVPDLVDREQLMNAIALNSGSMNVSRIAAPALAGVLVAPVGIGGGFIITLVFYAAAVVLFAGVRAERGSVRAREPFVRALGDGVRYISGAPLLLVLLLAGTLPMIFGMPAQILLPAFADVFDVGAAGVGVMQAAAGAGGLAGALIAATIGRPRRPAVLMTLGLVGFGAFQVVFALSPHLAPALLALALADVAAMLGMTVNSTIIQERLPEAVRGRVMSLMMMTFGLTPLAVLPASAAARAFGVQATVAGSGLLLVTLAVLLYSFSKRLRSLDRPQAVPVLPLQPAPLE